MSNEVRHGVVGQTLRLGTISTHHIDFHCHLGAKLAVRQIHLSAAQVRMVPIGGESYVLTVGRPGWVGVVGRFVNGRCAVPSLRINKSSAPESEWKFEPLSRTKRMVPVREAPAGFLLCSIPSCDAFPQANAISPAVQSAHVEHVRLDRSEVIVYSPFTCLTMAGTRPNERQISSYGALAKV